MIFKCKGCGEALAKAYYSASLDVVLTYRQGNRWAREVLTFGYQKNLGHIMDRLRRRLKRCPKCGRDLEWGRVEVGVEARRT